MAEKITPDNALKKLDKQLECPFCLDPFKEPKLLPCFHVFCKSPCLEKLVARDRQSLQCPICRHIVPLPAKGVSGLQTAFHITHLFEIQKIFSKVDKYSDQKCRRCNDNQATKYCHDCEQFVCNDCCMNHKMVNALNNHKFICLDELQSDAIDILRPKKVVLSCPTHSNKELEIYCETCCELICKDCAVYFHKDHNYDLIGEVFAKYKEEIVSSLRPVREKLDTVQQTLKVFDSRTKDITEQRVTIEDDIHKEFDQVQRLLAQQRDQLVGTLDKLTQQKLKSLAAQTDQVEIAQAKLASCLEYVDGGLKTCTEEEILAMKDPVLTCIEQIDTEFNVDTIQPETKPDLEFLTDGKELLYTSCKQFAEITTDILRSKRSCIDDNDKETVVTVVTVGEQMTVEFPARTKTIKKSTPNLDLTAELVHMKSEKRLRCEVIEQENETNQISYQPIRRGKHELHVTLGGTHVEGSPYVINVIPSAQSLNVPGRTMGSLNSPTSTVINSRGQLLVTEYGAHCISILNQTGKKIKTFGTLGSADGQLTYPCGVAVDRDDNIYVVDNSNHRVQKFTSGGRFATVVGGNGSNHLQFKYPVGICFHDKTNSLYVCDQYNHRIQVLSTDMKFKSLFGTCGSGDGQFHNPICIALDNTDNLYVTDSDNHRVQVFTAEGQFLRAFTEKANGEKLKFPFAIAIDSSNTVYVSESGSHCVSAFTSKGEYITSFCNIGSEEGQFKYVCGLSIDANDFIIVSHRQNRKLQIF